MTVKEIITALGIKKAKNQRMGIGGTPRVVRGELAGLDRRKYGNCFFSPIVKWGA